MILTECARHDDILTLNWSIHNGFPRNESGTIASFFREDANLIAEKQRLAALLD